LVAQIFLFADVTVDVGRRKITRGSEAMKVTRAEYNLLLYRLKNGDRARLAMLS
jgi:DNA-binding response OmpR family regulator